MEGRAASRTAVLVCQGRAVAHGRFAVGRFDDPVALALLRPEERTPVEHARASTPVQGWRARTGAALLGRQAESMAVRTVAVDDAVRAARNPQLVLLGAGLDGRSWRMSELAEVDVFEVDHPASQQDKRERAAHLTPVARSLRFVPADLTSPELDAALTSAGHDPTRPTTWVLEGLIPYLSPEEADSTVRVTAQRSAAGSQVIVSYQLASQGAAVARLLARVLLRVIGHGDPMADEPRRSTWSSDSVRDLLTEAGLTVVEDIGLASLADELSVPTRQLGASRVAVATSRPA